MRTHGAGSMGKGQQTRQAILDQALDLSSELGLEGLTFGVLARRASMSKSGLYAHFDSKEHLQCEVLDTAASRFVDVVVAPALKRPRGLPRVEALFERWMRWETDEMSGGCLFIGAAAEFDDRPGAVKDNLVGHLRDMLGAVARAAAIAAEEGHLAADLDTEQFAFELWGILLAFQHYANLLARPEAEANAHRAFQSLIRRSEPTT